MIYTKLIKILNNADSDDYVKRATPKMTPKMTEAKLSRARSYLKSGYSMQEVADMLNVSVSFLGKEIRGDE